jgi:hypothetical protein
MECIDCIHCVPDMSSSCRCDCVKDLSRQQKASILSCFWAGIGGIVALTLNDVSECVALYDTLRVAGIGLIVFSFCYFGFFFFNNRGFSVLVLFTWFFMLVVDIILIVIFTGNQTDGLMSRGCTEGRGTLPWFILVWTSPFSLTFCCLFYVIEHNPDAFYGNSRSKSAEFQTLLL